MKRYLFWLFVLLLLLPIKGLNELIKFQLNESSNIFLVNLSEKGLDTIDLTQYTAYINSTTTLNNLTYFTDDFNNLYFLYNNTDNVSLFYLAKEGVSNIQLNTQIGQNYYKIVISNPNTYDLVNYQLKISLTKAVRGDQVFDFYDDLTNPALWTNNQYIYNGVWNYSGTGWVMSYRTFTEPNQFILEYYFIGNDIFVGFVDPSCSISLCVDVAGSSMFSSAGYPMTAGFLSSNSTNRQFSGDNIALNSTQWHLLKLIRRTDNTVSVTVTRDDGTIFTHSGTLTYPSLKNYIAIFGYWGATLEWLRIRKYADQEPSVTVNGNVITISNPNTYDLTDYQVRLPIKLPIFDLVDSNGNSLPFCFEHSNGECDEKPFDVQAIWVKVPLITAGSNLTIFKKNIFNYIYDTFNGGYDIDLWDYQSNGGTYTVYPDYIRFYGGGTLYLRNPVYSEGIVKITFSTSGTNGLVIYFKDGTSTTIYSYHSIVSNTVTDVIVEYGRNGYVIKYTNGTIISNVTGSPRYFIGMGVSTTGVNSLYLYDFEMIQPLFKVVNESYNLLPYCFEQANGECNTNPTSIMWVKVPFIPAGGTTTLKILNDSVNNAVNGDLVFDFYDDFTTFNKWIVIGGSWSVSNGVATESVLSGTGVPLIAYSPYFNFTNGIAETRIKINSGHWAGLYFRANGPLDSSGDYYMFVYGIGIGTTNKYFGIRSNGVYTGICNWYCGPTFNSKYNIWYTLKIIANNNYFETYIDNILYFNGLDTTFSSGYLAIGQADLYDGVVDYDWIRVRKYADQEPTYTIQEAQTTNVTQLLPYKKDFTATEYKMYFSSTSTNPTLPTYLNYQNITIYLNPLTLALNDVGTATIETLVNNNLITTNITIPLECRVYPCVDELGMPYACPCNFQDVYQQIINTQQFNEGNYTITNTTISINIDGFILSSLLTINNWFIIDRTPPTINIAVQEPTEGEKTTYPQYSYSYSVLEPYLNYCNFLFEEDGNILNQSTFTQTGTYNYNYLTRTGKHTLSLTIECYDKAGNYNKQLLSNQYTLYDFWLVTPYSQPQVLDNNTASQYKEEIRSLQLDLLENGNPIYQKIVISKDLNISQPNLIYFLTGLRDLALRWNLKSGLSYISLFAYHPISTSYLETTDSSNNPIWYILFPIPTNDYLSQLGINLPTDYGKLFQYTFRSYDLDAKLIIKSRSLPYVYFYYDFSLNSDIQLDIDTNQQYKEVIYYLPEGYYSITIQRTDGTAITKVDYLPPQNNYIYVIDSTNELRLLTLDFIRFGNSETSYSLKKDYANGQLTLVAYLDNTQYNETTGVSTGKLIVNISSTINITEANIWIYTFPGVVLLNNKYNNITQILISYNYSIPIPITNLFVYGYAILEDGTLVRFSESFFNIEWKGLPKWLVALMLLIAWAFTTRIVALMTEKDTLATIIVTLVFLNIAWFLDLFTNTYQVVITIILFLGAIVLILLRRVI